MEKKAVNIILALFIIFLSLFVPYEVYKGNFLLFTGKVTREISASFAVSDESPKLLSSISNITLSPDNSTTINLLSYFREPNGQNMTFSSTIGANLAVSIDNDTKIATITPSIGFLGKTSVVFHAYDSSNQETLSNNISIKISGIAVYYNNFSGNTTNFDSYTQEELQSLSSVVIENISYGKIEFDETINISGNTDLNSNINISTNYIFLNETGLPNLNKRATLSLYNLSFSNPRILKNGILCPSTTCKKISYASNTLVFNVTGFSYYSSEETPVLAPQGGDERIPKLSGGGGGGGIAKPGIVKGAEEAKPEEKETEGPSEESPEEKEGEIPPAEEKPEDIAAKKKIIAISVIRMILAALILAGLFILFIIEYKKYHKK